MFHYFIIFSPAIWYSHSRPIRLSRPWTAMGYFIIRSKHSNEIRAQVDRDKRRMKAKNEKFGA
jgi:hypothetical protein